jgi:hypothetical protein
MGLGPGARTVEPARAAVPRRRGATAWRVQRAGPRFGDHPPLGFFTADVTRHHRPRIALVVPLLLPTLAGAQSPEPAGPRWSVGAQAIGVATHASPERDGRSSTEWRVTRPTIAGRLQSAGGGVALIGTLSLEGATMRDGETNPGIWGEGFADRRHPHTWLHELVAVATTDAGRAGVLSVAVGKGFVPFGTDDPMTRPFVKYPANHHLAQILERALVVASWRAGPATIEGAVFNGDEPEDPSDAPNLDRFGDSWAARLTLALPMAVEAQASGASLDSPEWAAGFGPDQRKWSASARYESGAETDASHYALVEWARTEERVDGRTIFRFASVLAEGAVRRRGVEIALRLERTTRPEEERLLDPFRVARPHTDESILGVTRFEIVTLAASVPAGAGRLPALAGIRPFAEVALVHPTAARTPSLFRPERFFGSRTLWTLSAGARLALGAGHRRMGRYGAAAPAGRAHRH